MRKSSGKVIITCAVTGSIHAPSMSPHLPITPDQIAEESVRAAEAGAAMLHLHARDPRTGRPDQSPQLFQQFLPRIKQATDAIINITTGGGLGMSLDERLAAAKWAQPETPSAASLALYPPAGCFRAAAYCAKLRSRTWRRCARFDCLGRARCDARSRAEGPPLVKRQQLPQPRIAQPQAAPGHHSIGNGDDLAAVGEPAHPEMDGVRAAEQAGDEDSPQNRRRRKRVYKTDEELHRPNKNHEFLG